MFLLEGETMATSEASNLVETVTREAAQLREFLSGLDAETWASDSTCEGWTIEDAVAQATRYYPRGDRRSATGGRTIRLGSGLRPAEYYEAANRETPVITMIERPEAVTKVRQITSVPGIDAVLVGSSDLTHAMGMPPSSEVDAALADVIKGANAEGIGVGVAGAGMTVNNIDRYKQFASQGVQLFSVGAQELIKRSGDEFLAALR
jgi:2-keto-3-deoxy-L-rhamnonate aldolase RhmA